MKNIKISISIILIIICLMCHSTVCAETEGIFTPEEQLYINQHSEIYIAGNTALEPVEYYKDGKYNGILPEIFNKVSEISGIKFTYINNDADWKELSKNNQVEIVSGIDGEINLENYNLRNSIQLIRFPIDNESAEISIAFTGIADEQLIEIMRKSLNQISEFDKQEIIITNIMSDNTDVAKLSYVFFPILILLLIISVISYMLYKKYKKATIVARYTDNITGLGNFQYMRRNFNMMITDNNRTSYCIVNIGLDVNHIEKIYGYSEVEKILRDISVILKKDIKKYELFARVYKDSFVIMADFISEQNILDRVTYIISEIKKVPKFRNRKYGLNLYAGIYVLKQTDITLDEAVYNSMLAKRSAKEQGGQVKICSKALILKARKENNMEKEMLTALQNNEFLTYVQPLVDLKTNTTPYLESLSRWENPKIGLVKPSTFMTIFENNSLMDKLDFQMYENICKMLSALIKANKEPYIVFCNFARQTVENKAFFSELDRIAQKYEVPRKFLGITLQENLTNYNISNLKIITTKLKDLGFTILLSDFDASGLSFKEIAQLNIDYLKISFKLTDSLDDLKTSEIIRGIIGTLHELNIKVICEDFNKDKQYEQRLKAINCDILQGNAYYPPIPIEEL